MSQVHDVLDYMERHGSIDAYRAASELGVMRLAARIADLKRLGVVIESRTITNPENGKHWSEYRRGV